MNTYKEKKMNTYIVKSDGGRIYGPFKTASAAAKWANRNLRGSWGRLADYSILRLFSPS